MILENCLNKVIALLVVIFLTSFSFMFKSSDIFFTIWIVCIGSFLLPLNGWGVKYGPSVSIIIFSLIILSYLLFGGDDQKKDVSYIENISDDQEIINGESVSETAIEKDANIPNNILEDQISFDQDPDIPTIDIDFERDDKKILSDDNVSEIEIIVQGESWVEIIDNEQILLFELLQTGLYEVTGYGPFKFKIGHSPSVKIYLNGKNIDFSETVSQYTDYAHFLFENGVVVELFKD